MIKGVLFARRDASWHVQREYSTVPALQALVIVHK